MKRRRIKWYKPIIMVGMFWAVSPLFLVILSILSCTSNRGLIPLCSSDRSAALINPSPALGYLDHGDPQELANEANAAIYSSFARNENGALLYPGDFGGAYFENDKLIICIIHEQDRDHYQSLLNASQKSIVIYKVVKHNFNDLLKIAKELATHEDVFITYGVDVMNNRAEVCLPDEDKVKSNNRSIAISGIPAVYKYMQRLQ